MIERMTSRDSDYKKAFSKEREKKLKNYSKILEKSKQDEEIRDNMFSLYEQMKLVRDSLFCTTRPTSGKRTLTT
jgi:hypothetical protein